MLSSLSRLRLRAALALASLAFALAACGGNDDDPPVVSHAAQVQAAAASGVAQGLVGAATGVVTATHADTAVAGLARVDTNTPVTAATLFGLGSNTKAMTACVAARVIDQGLIRWDTRVVDALPELQSTMLPAYANVTLEQLLAHKGGLRAYTGSTDMNTFGAYLATASGPLPDTETGRRHFFVQFALTQSPPAGVVPGTTFSYSNAGYALAAAMLEKVTGKSYEALFDAELTQPLDVPGAWGAPDRSGATQPHGYYGTVGHLSVEQAADADTQAWFDVINPAGGFSTTPAAYARWLQWHLRALQGQSTPLPAGYVQRLHALALGDYAVGWVAMAGGGHVMLVHDGALNGFIDEAAIEQSGQSASFAMTNTSDLADDDTTGSWVVGVLNALVVDLDKDAR